MHGIIFVELKKFADALLGEEAWDGLLKQAELVNRIYLPVQEYPDAEAVALVGAVCARTGRTADAVLSEFGRFIVPDLLRMYGSLLDRGWTTLEVIENTEETIHRVVRARNPGARPPELHCSRPSPHEVVVVYRSRRRLCGIAKGIVEGLAEHFHERVTLDETRCMLRGDPECRIHVLRV